MAPKRTRTPQPETPDKRQKDYSSEESGAEDSAQEDATPATNTSSTQQSQRQEPPQTTSDEQEDENPTQALLRIERDQDAMYASTSEDDSDQDEPPQNTSQNSSSQEDSSDDEQAQRDLEIIEQLTQQLRREQEDGRRLTQQHQELTRIISLATNTENPQAQQDATQNNPLLATPTTTQNTQSATLEWKLIQEIQHYYQEIQHYVVPESPSTKSQASPGMKYFILKSIIQESLPTGVTNPSEEITSGQIFDAIKITIESHKRLFLLPRIKEEFERLGFPNKVKGEEQTIRLLNQLKNEYKQALEISNNGQEQTPTSPNDDSTIIREQQEIQQIADLENGAQVPNAEPEITQHPQPSSPSRQQ